MFEAKFDDHEEENEIPGYEEAEETGETGGDEEGIAVEEEVLEIDSGDEEEPGGAAPAKPAPRRAPSRAKKSRAKAKPKKARKTKKPAAKKKSKGKSKAKGRSKGRRRR